jgi:hypothetical protein
MAKSRGRKKPNRPNSTARREVGTLPPQPPLPPPTTPRHRNYRRAVEWSIGTVLSVLALLAAIYQLSGGPPWPTSIDIDPGPPDLSQAFNVPFVATNRSSLFSAYDTHFNCILDDVEINDTGALRDDLFIGPEPMDIGPLEAHPFRCWVPIKAIRIRHGAIRVVSFHKFRFLVEWEWRSAPIIFTWDTKAVPPRWLKGRPIGPTFKW